jgi:hypothetical protein
MGGAMWPTLDDLHIWLKTAVESAHSPPFCGLPHRGRSRRYGRWRSSAQTCRDQVPLV